MTKNRQKKGSLNRDLLNFVYRYGIFWMPPGDSSHPGGSENVYERWVQHIFDPVLVARSCVSATKWGPLAKLLGVTKKCISHKFRI